MKSPTMPATKISTEDQQVTQQEIENRQLPQDFTAQALQSRNKARQSGRYVSAEAVMGRLEEMLATSQRTR